jgi:hypothetical protein
MRFRQLSKAFTAEAAEPEEKIMLLCSSAHSAVKGFLGGNGVRTWPD